MACSGKGDCTSCVAARNGFDACEWVMDSEPNFCHNWYDCPNCYHDKAVFDGGCPTDAATVIGVVNGVVIGVVVALCICMVIACVIFQQRARRTRTRSNNTNNVSSLPNPIPQPQPVPQPQPQPIQQQAYIQQTEGVQLQPPPQIIYVQAPMNQPVQNDAPPAYEDVNAEPPAYTIQ